MIAHQESVSPELLEKLLALSSLDTLKRAALGGGTSLALVYGHRKSIDIDFFLTDSFDSILLQDSLALRFHDFSLVNRTAGSLSAILGSVKIDILLHSYPLLQEYSTFDSVRFLSLPDMAAMKVNAVTDRGSKKDFSDLLLLDENGIPLQKSLDFFCAKYGPAGRFLAIRSLNWFEDAEGGAGSILLERLDLARCARTNVQACGNAGALGACRTYERTQEFLGKKQGNEGQGSAF